MISTDFSRKRDRKTASPNSTAVAFNIGAALQYTAQVVHVLALLLDVNLPYRLGYG